MALTSDQVLLVVGGFLLAFLIVWAFSGKKREPRQDQDFTAEPELVAVDCPVCDGSGWSRLDPDLACGACNGEGQIAVYRRSGAPVRPSRR